MGAPLGELAGRLVQVSDIYAARAGVSRDDDRSALKPMEEAGELAAEHEAALDRKWFRHLETAK